MAGIHLVFLLLSLLAFSASAKVFLSIDCGASDTYTDENKIKWIPDDDYVKGGKSQVVQSTHSIDQVIDTLRVFKTGTKNCYSIKVDKGERVLVRASFYYGNYDNKLSPPKFDVLLNGNFWSTVLTDNTNDVYTYAEAIYVAEGGNISVCVVQTFDGQIPFISALEVRSLDANMYSGIDDNRPLHVVMRAYGSDTGYVRYPDDIYDRLWHPTTLTPTISNSLLVIDVKVEDNPPQVVLQNAVTSSETNSSIEFSLETTELKKDEVPVYINMYFTELVELDSTDKRSFHVYVDDKRISSTPVTPPYGSVKELTFSNITASNTTIFSLKATSDSTMPPIINAFEVFTYVNVLDNYDDSGTDTKKNGKNDDSGTSSIRASQKYIMVMLFIYMVYHQLYLV